MISYFRTLFTLMLLLYGFEVCAKSESQIKSQTKRFAELPAKLEIYKKAVLATYDLKLLPNLKKLEQEALQANNPKVQAEALLLVALLKHRYGDYKDSLMLNQAALEIAQTLEEPSLLIEVYLAIVGLEVALERFKQANEKMRKIDMLISSLSEISTLKAKISLWKARIYFHQGSYYQSLHILNEIINTSNISKDVYVELIIEKAKVKLKLGDHLAAQALLDQITSANLGNQLQHIQLLIKVLQSRVYLQAGLFVKSILTAQDALKSTFYTRFLEQQADLQNTLASSYAQIQDYQMAHLYLKRYAFSQKALDLQKRNNKLLQLEAKYDFEQQKQQLSLLEKDNALKQQKITQQKQAIENTELIQQRVILLVVLFFTLIFFLYWRWQSKRTLNVLEQQVTERTQELAIRNKQLQALSYTDSLTGAYNRHFLFTHIDEYLPQGNFSGSTIMCLIDIDYFKQINDSYGHSAGDEVLKSFVSVLRGTIRQNDVVIRWGGQEFLLVMPNISREAAAEILERIRTNIEQYHFFENGENISVTASFGFSSLPLIRDQSILDWEQTLDLADFCLYLAKRGGRNAWVGATELITSESIDAKSILRDTRTLIRDKKLKAVSNQEDIINML